MIDINLESMKDVLIRKLDRSRIELILINKDGGQVAIVTTIQNGEAIHDELEKVCINEAYHYQNMQDEIDRLTQEVEELKERLGE